MHTWSPTRLRDLGPLVPYDIHPDGKRLAGIAAVEQSNPNLDKVVFLSHFFDYLKKTVPAAGR